VEKISLKLIKTLAVFTFSQKTEGKRPLRAPKRKLKDNTKTDLRETGFEDVNLIDMALDKGQWKAFDRTVMNLYVP
jgi:hypothetical protein